MFNKWGLTGETIKTEDNGKKEKEVKEVREDIVQKAVVPAAETKKSHAEVNKILKGSKLTGDINVTCDLELSGDVEGNIRSLQDSNILIRGTCKGNIETAGGSVDIDGELMSGNITAGKDVKISGKFNGGEVKAKGKVYVNGEFSGKLEGSDIEIGPGASGKGELLYKEFISISRGAKVEVHISRVQDVQKAAATEPRKKEADIPAAPKETVAAH